LAPSPPSVSSGEKTLPEKCLASLSLFYGRVTVNRPLIPVKPATCSGKPATHSDERLKSGRFHAGMGARFAPEWLPGFPPESVPAFTRNTHDFDKWIASQVIQIAISLNKSRVK
jgi:hypothetical protein